MKIIKQSKQWIETLTTDKDSNREVDQAVINDDVQMALRREMFEKYKSDLSSRELSNSQQYDKAILTLSSAGFAISVTAFETIRDHGTTDHVLSLIHI